MAARFLAGLSLVDRCGEGDITTRPRRAQSANEMARPAAVRYFCQVANRVALRNNARYIYYVVRLH